MTVAGSIVQICFHVEIEIAAATRTVEARAEEENARGGAEVPDGGFLCA